MVRGARGERVFWVGSMDDTRCLATPTSSRLPHCRPPSHPRSPLASPASTPTRSRPLTPMRRHTPSARQRGRPQIDGGACRHAARAASHPRLVEVAGRRQGPRDSCELRRAQSCRRAHGLGRTQRASGESMASSIGSSADSSSTTFALSTGGEVGATGGKPQLPWARLVGAAAVGDGLGRCGRAVGRLVRRGVARRRSSRWRWHLWGRGRRPRS